MDTIRNLPNWAKLSLLGLGAGGAGLLANGMTEDEDEETGERKSRYPWLGPAIGLGGLGLGAGYLTDWDPKRMLNKDWWTNKSSSY